MEKVDWMRILKPVKRLKTATEEAGQQRALEEIREEIENVRAAWRWAVKHGKLERIGRMAEALWLFYEMQGWSVEGEETFRKATEIPTGPG
jgi:hypothetical protein